MADAPQTHPENLSNCRWHITQQCACQAGKGRDGPAKIGECPKETHTRQNLLNCEISWPPSLRYILASTIHGSLCGLTIKMPLAFWITPAGSCALPPATCGQRHRGDQAGIRLTIVRHLRAVLDREELAAIEDARADGMQWAAISRLLGMQHPGSAMNRRERLKAGTERPDGRRTREARKRISDNNY